MFSIFLPSDPVYFFLENPDAGNQPQILVGVTANLNITIVNHTGADITMTTDSNIELFMPSLFTRTQIGAMSISNVNQTGWTFSYDSPNGLLLTYTVASGTWAKDANLTFTINFVTSTASPTIAAIKANLNNLGGVNVPASLQPQNLALLNNTPPQAPDLSSILQMGLDNQGLVYVSSASDPLSNTLFLNIKNIGDTPLYNDTANPWPVKPTIDVSFIYGTTVGCLAPADNSGQAWDIGASVVTNQGWTYQNPTNNNDGSTPVWSLFPEASNATVLGTGPDANVTFAFSNINSFTPAGHTQMMLTFNNFMMNHTTAYKPVTIILDISKQDPPPTRGLFSFLSPGGSIITLTEPSFTVSIPLRWAMFYVDNIKLVCSIPGVPVLSRDYYRKDATPNIPPLNYDHFKLDLPIQVSQDTPVFITLQAFDNENNYLNALQFTVFITASFFVDPAGQVYPTVYLNNQTWLGANYNYQYNLGISCVAYKNNTGYRAQYGLLYTQAAAGQITPPGWRVPTQADWNDLISFIGADAFTALMTGGTSGFDAQAGGMGDNLGGFNGMPTQGYYWTSTPDSQNPAKNVDVLFDTIAQKVNTLNAIDKTYFLSLRYVKNT